MQAPDPDTLEKFLGRVPMVFNVVIVSPHGYFGQANVLGMPDTGGQVRTVLLMRGRELSNGCRSGAPKCCGTGGTVAHVSWPWTL